MLNLAFLQVLKPRTIAGQIESAAKNYLEKNVKVVQNNNRVSTTFSCVIIKLNYLRDVVNWKQ